MHATLGVRLFTCVLSLTCISSCDCLCAFVGPVKPASLVFAQLHTETGPTVALAMFPVDRQFSCITRSTRAVDARTTGEAATSAVTVAQQDVDMKDVSDDCVQRQPLGAGAPKMAESGSSPPTDVAVDAMARPSTGAEHGQPQGSQMTKPLPYLERPYLRVPADQPMRWLLTWLHGMLAPKTHSHSKQHMLEVWCQGTKVDAELTIQAVHDQLWLPNKGDSDVMTLHYKSCAEPQ